MAQMRATGKSPNPFTLWKALRSALQLRLHSGPGPVSVLCLCFTAVNGEALWRLRGHLFTVRASSHPRSGRPTQDCILLAMSHCPALSPCKEIGPGQGERGGRPVHAAPRGPGWGPAVPLQGVRGGGKGRKENRSVALDRAQNHASVGAGGSHGAARSPR